MDANKIKIERDIARENFQIYRDVCRELRKSLKFWKILYLLTVLIAGGGIITVLSYVKVG